MIFYHGSDIAIENPDINHSSKHLDFGAGFYVTTVKRQAKRWAKRKAVLHGSKKGYVSVRGSYEVEL